MQNVPLTLLKTHQAGGPGFLCRLPLAQTADTGSPELWKPGSSRVARLHELGCPSVFWMLLEAGEPAPAEPAACLHLLHACKAQAAQALQPSSCSSLP